MCNTAVINYAKQLCKWTKEVPFKLALEIVYGDQWVTWPVYVETSGF